MAVLLLSDIALHCSGQSVALRQMLARVSDVYGADVCQLDWPRLCQPQYPAAPTGGPTHGLDLSW